MSEKPLRQIKNEAAAAFLVAIDMRLVDQREHLDTFEYQVWMNQRNRLRKFFGCSKHEYPVINDTHLEKLR